MPVRHCVFVCDLAEMEKAFQLPLSTYVGEFLERPTPGDRLRGYAELAFANEEQIQTLRKQDRGTMVMARRLMITGQGPASELPSHLQDVTADFGPQAFADAGRAAPERLQMMTRENCNRLRAFLQTPSSRPSILVFIGA